MPGAGGDKPETATESAERTKGVHRCVTPTGTFIIAYEVMGDVMTTHYGPILDAVFAHNLGDSRMPPPKESERNPAAPHFIAYALEALENDGRVYDIIFNPSVSTIYNRIAGVVFEAVRGFSPGAPDRRALIFNPYNRKKRPEFTPVVVPIPEHALDI